MTRRRLIVLLMLFAVLTVVSLRMAVVGSRAYLGRDSLANTRPAPKVILRYDTRSLGTVSQGSLLRVPFPIRNAGRRRLVVSDSPEMCCGSHAAQPRYLILGPGQAGTFTVEADTATWCGRMRHTVHLATNDPGRPRIALTVEALVTTELRSCPSRLAESCAPYSSTVSSEVDSRRGLYDGMLSHSY